MRIRSLLAASAALLTLAGTSGIARAQNLNTLLAGCSALPTQQARMECYEGVSRGANGGNGGYVPPVSAERSSGASTTSGSAPAVSTPAGFGSDSLKRKAPKQKSEKGTTKIQARVASAVDNGIGRWTIALQDGAKWRTTEAMATFQPPHPNDVVAIRRGAMGGYLMDFDGQPSIYVTRVQ